MVVAVFEFDSHRIAPPPNSGMAKKWLPSSPSIPPSLLPFLRSSAPRESTKFISAAFPRRVVRPSAPFVRPVHLSFRAGRDEESLLGLQIRSTLLRWSDLGRMIDVRCLTDGLTWREMVIFRAVGDRGREVSVPEIWLCLEVKAGSGGRVSYRERGRSGDLSLSLSLSVFLPSFLRPLFSFSSTSAFDCGARESSAWRR